MRRFLGFWLVMALASLSAYAEMANVDVDELRKGLADVGEKLIQIGSKLPSEIAKTSDAEGSLLPENAVTDMGDAEKALTIGESSVTEIAVPDVVEKSEKHVIKKPVLKNKKMGAKKTKKSLIESVPAEPTEKNDVIEPADAKKQLDEEAVVTSSQEKMDDSAEKAEKDEKGETPKDLLEKSTIKPVSSAKKVEKVINGAEIGLKPKDIDDERIKEKMRRAEKMVNDAIAFFKKNSLGSACRSFEQDAEWRAGDLYISIFSDVGACLLDGQFTQRLWDDFLVPTRDELTGLIVSDSFVAQMLELGEEGGWISYDWDFGIRFAYAKTVIKHGLKYVITIGFYPDSERFAVQQLVKKAIRYGERSGAHQLFEQINNPRGVFVRGDLYLWAYDFDGFAYAHGRNIVYVGQNRKDWKDSTGFRRNKRIIEIVQSEGRGWVDYVEDGLPKKAYVEGFVDPRSGRRYIVGGGYYPTINDDMVVNFVKRGINYLKANGADVAFRDFSSYAGKFVQGPLRIFAYDLEGTMLADSENPIFIGQNLLHTKDVEGTEIVVKILAAVKNDAGSGWITFKDKGAYRSLYVEYVEVPDGKFIIGAGYWPSSKDYIARSLAEKAVNYFKANEMSEAIRACLTPSNEWMRGDLCVKVYSAEGICLAAGQDRARIWHDENRHLDDKGYSVFRKILSTARGGGGVVDYSMYGYPYHAYVNLVEKPISLETAEVRAAERKEMREKDKKKSKFKVVGESEDEDAGLTEQFIISVGYFL